MDYGFFRVAAASPQLKVCDTNFNAEQIITSINQASLKGAQLVVFPELSITGYTCGDLFLQETLLQNALSELERIVKETAGLPVISIAGLPVKKNGSLYNAAAVFYRGEILAVIPKSFIPNYCEFYERRHFSPAQNILSEKNDETIYLGKKNPAVPFGTDIIISAEGREDISIGVEICEDLWVPLPPSTKHALNGATIIANLSASNEIIGKAEYRRLLVKSHSAKIIGGYIYANAGHDESTQDLIFSSHNLICENGSLVSESRLFSNEMIFADLDVERLTKERSKTSTYSQSQGLFGKSSYRKISVKLNPIDYDKEMNLFRSVSKEPFVPADNTERSRRCEEVVTLQAEGLAKRLRHVNAKNAVIGLSGGLDSTLALLVTARAFDLCKLDRKGILAVTMPCFGTTDRTYSNAIKLAEHTGVSIKEINIKEAVRVHFRDIEQDESVHDVTYENCQARERTQILMDLANKTNALVIGTGDLSELALGWATYNGDHMSMYGVNGSIPKTLVRHLVSWEADVTQNNELSMTLKDILDTPVSPELLPPTNGNISQRTEEIVGPYQLHDFFLYNLLRFGFTPSKIFFLAKHAFTREEYSMPFIKNWMKTFYRRFFSQQFKRSCLPDGAKVGTVNLSPRGDWRMPSDASSEIWLREIDNLD